MDAAFFWDLFIETGAPEAYMFYKQMQSEQKQLE